MGFFGIFVDLVDADFVERLAGRLDSDSRVDGVGTDLVKREGVGEGLGDRLNGEFGCGIAGFVDEPIRGRQGQPESIRVDTRQLGDVVGQGAFCDTGVFFADPVQVALHESGHGADVSPEAAMSDLFGPFALTAPHDDVGFPPENRYYRTFRYVCAGRAVFSVERYRELTCRGHILATFSATESRSDSNRSAYTSNVMAALACPSIRWTTFGFAPALIASDAAWSKDDADHVATGLGAACGAGKRVCCLCGPGARRALPHDHSSGVTFAA